jgi:uncharacterized protein YciI
MIILKEFIYVLKLIDRLRTQNNWTVDDEKIVENHFNYLKQLQKDQKLILAGKTDGLDDHTFGIVIFEAASYEEALNIMNYDPSIVCGIMQGQLFPYSVALIRDNHK